MATNEAKKTDSRLAARCAAIASLGAAVIHVAVTPMHWRDWMPSGLFFAALAGFQLLWAIAAWRRPGAVVLAAGIAANAGAAGLWVMSCVMGPPFGPSAGQPEAVGAAGIAVLLLQTYVIMGAVWAWSRKYQPEQVSGVGRALVLMGANTLMAGAVTVGLIASLQGHHHHHSDVAEAQSDHHGAHDTHGGGHDAADPVDDHADRHAEVHQHPAAPQSPPVIGATTVPAPEEEGRPLTDMGLNSAEPARAQPESANGPVESSTETDGHQHHHDD